MRHYNNAYPLNHDKRTRRKNERKNPKPWILPWLENDCARKNNLYHKFVHAPTAENKTKYDKMNEFCDKHIDIAKLRYRKKYFDDYKDNSRKQWQMINELLNRRKSNIRVNKLIDKDGKVHNTPTAIAENFNEYFANIASNLKNEIMNRSDVTAGESYKEFLQQPVENELCLSNVSPHEVHKVVKNFKNKSTLDTKSFNEGVFPQQLKTARVVPIFKKVPKLKSEIIGPYRCCRASQKFLKNSCITE